jgi:hypothetical protein
MNILLLLAILAAPSQFVVDNEVNFITPRFEDLRFPTSALTAPPGLAPFGTPDLIQFPVGGSTDTYAYCFDASADEGLTFVVQFPHARKENTNLSPHVHWSPSTGATGDVTWVLVCTATTDFTETFTGTQTITMTDAADEVANKHQYIDGTDIIATSSSVSAMVACSIYRDVDNGDDYGADACLLEVDFHYAVDTPGGSKALWAK